MSRRMTVCAGRTTEVSVIYIFMNACSRNINTRGKISVRKQSLLEPHRKQVTHLNIKFPKFKLKFLGICGYCHWTNF